jgi:hypothetical protein
LIKLATLCCIAALSICITVSLDYPFVDSQMC